MYYAGSQRKQDYFYAFKWYKLAAEQEDPLALNALGELYARGLGTKRDYVKALACFQAAAKQNIVTALFNLGYIYNTGNYGQKLDKDKGMYYYLQAANLGYAPAMFTLGKIYCKDNDKLSGYKWLCLAEKYAQGIFTDKKDLAACKAFLTNLQKSEAEEWVDKWESQLFAEFKKVLELNGICVYSFMPYRSQVYRFVVELKEEDGKVLGHYKVVIERFLKGNIILVEPSDVQTKNKMYGLIGKRTKEGNVVFNWYNYSYSGVKGTAVVEAGEGQNILWTTIASNDSKRMGLPQVQKKVTMIKTNNEIVIDGRL